MEACRRSSCILEKHWTKKKKRNDKGRNKCHKYWQSKHAGNGMVFYHGLMKYSERRVTTKFRESGNVSNHFCYNTMEHDLGKTTLYRRIYEI